MKKHFEQLGKKKFKFYAISVLLINDFYNAFSLYTKYQSKQYLVNLINHSLELTGQKSATSQLNGQFYDQLFTLFSNSLNIALLLLLSFHLIIYYLFYRETKAAKIYVKMVGIVASLYYIIILFASLKKINFIFLTDLLQGLSYIFITMGIFYLIPKHQNNKN